MKRIFSFILALTFGAFLVGCGGSSVKTPTEQVENTFKFDGINMNFMQKHEPTKVVYQDKSIVEKKLNDEIANGLKEKGLLNQKSSDKIAIDLNYRRQFVGEDTFAKSDSIANIFFTYEIKILRGDKVLRNIIQNSEMRYNPGFLGNLKTIAGANRSDEFENEAITKIAKHLVEKIEKIN